MTNTLYIYTNIAAIKTLLFILYVRTHTPVLPTENDKSDARPSLYHTPLPACNDNSLYSRLPRVRTDFQPEFFPDQEKKTYSLECHSRNGGCNHFHPAQPDLTRTVVVVPSCYEYPFTNDQNAYSLTRSCSEHHYDVPHHNGGGSSTVTTGTLAPPVPSVAPDSPNALTSSPESSHSLTSYTCSSECKRAHGYGSRRKRF